MSGDAVPMNDAYKTLLDPKAPVLSGPSRKELREQASTVSAEPPQLTKGKHSKIGGMTRRRGAGFMDKVRSVAKAYNNAEDEFAGDSTTDSINNQSEMLAKGDLKGLAGTLRGKLNEIRELKETLRPTQQAGTRKTRRVGKGRGDIVLTLMAIRDQIKVYHWQTSKYARHIATNDLVASLDKNIDEFVEVYMGKYGRPKITKTIKLHNFSESAARAFVAKQTEFLTKKMPTMLKSTDSDLLNIRDTILADVNKTLYLFTLR
jgi:hypothetical protein